LKGDHLVPSLHSVNTVKRKIRQGQRTLDYYLCLHFDQAAPGENSSEQSINPAQKKINFSKSLIFKLITDDDDQGNGDFNPDLS